MPHKFYIYLIFIIFLSFDPQAPGCSAREINARISNIYCILLKIGPSQPNVFNMNSDEPDLPEELANQATKIQVTISTQPNKNHKIAFLTCGTQFMNWILVPPPGTQLNLHYTLLVILLYFQMAKLNYWGKD